MLDVGPLCEYTVFREREIGASQSNKLLVIFGINGSRSKIMLCGFLNIPEGMRTVTGKLC